MGVESEFSEDAVASNRKLCEPNIWEIGQRRRKAKAWRESS